VPLQLPSTASSAAAPSATAATASTATATAAASSTATSTATTTPSSAPAAGTIGGIQGRLFRRQFVLRRLAIVRGCIGSARGGSGGSSGGRGGCLTRHAKARCIRLLFLVSIIFFRLVVFRSIRAVHGRITLLFFRLLLRALLGRLCRLFRSRKADE
jgi:hypothetical protein